MAHKSEAEREAERRVAAAMPRCRCRKWRTYIGVYDVDGRTVRCYGCRRAIWRCTC